MLYETGTDFDMSLISFIIDIFLNLDGQILLTHI